jgi:hypothetical protein
VAAPGETGEHFIQGPGSGTEDAINSKLSAGEFVIPADVVASLGDGNTNHGAKKLDNLLVNVRQQKATKMKKGKLPPDAHDDPMDYMK